MKTGIYKMSFPGTEHFYIGSAARDFRRRWDNHNCRMKKGTHTPFIQRCFNKYGQPVFGIVEEVIPEDCIKREQHWMDKLSPDLNATPVSGSTLGYRFTDIQKQKISTAVSVKLTGRKLSEAHRNNISKAIKNRMTPEHRKVISDSVKATLARKKQLKLETNG